MACALPLYRIEGLTKTYGEGDTAVQALRGVNLDVPQSAMVVLLGPSGSGKSTFLNIVGGLDQASSGHVHFEHIELTGLDDYGLTEYRRHHVGFVFQFYNLVASLTARENVALITEIADDPMEPAEALALVGLESRLDHFPTQLSGGEQQRVAIARAIVTEPSTLFADEPTGNLDSVTTGDIMELLKRLNEDRGITVLMVTHDDHVATVAKRRVVIKDGLVESDITAPP